MATYILRKVSRLPGNAFFARWRLFDNRVVEHALTEQEYRSLALKGAGAPPNRTGDAQAAWLLAYEAWTFDTPSGRMEPGDATDAWDGVVRIQAERQHKHISIPVNRIIGTLDQMTADPADLPAGVTLVDGVLTDLR